LENFFDIKFRLWREHNLDPNWVESIPFYEYQIWLEKLNQAIEKENRSILEETGKKEIFNFSK
jgi:G:T-mismatch repair DNA endonuclease (very short patch repair protein)